MSPRHAPRRAEIILVEPALTQVTKLTPAETHALDRALVALSVDPAQGYPTRHPALLDYWDPIEDVRVIYYTTIGHTVVVVGYVEA
jgi:hypothetical protein